MGNNVQRGPFWSTLFFDKISFTGILSLEREVGNTIMDTLAAFLNETSKLCITFSIERRLVRELPNKPATPARQRGPKENLLGVHKAVSLKELPDKLSEARFWLPRAYYKPIVNSTTDVNAIFHLVKCAGATPLPHDIQSENLFRIFRNLCLANNYRLSLFQYEEPGQYGLLCLP